MVSRVDAILGMDPYADDGDEVSFGNGENDIPSPYLQYAGGDAGVAVAEDKPRDKSRPKTGKRKEKVRDSSNENGSGSANYNGTSNGASSRPKSAARRREVDTASPVTAYKETSSRHTNDEELYPTARGLLRK